MKQELLEQREKIKQSIFETNRQFNQLNIDLNKVDSQLFDILVSEHEMKVGDKVKTSRNEIGVVGGFTWDTRGESIKPRLLKLKKDGTASKNELHMWYSDTCTSYSDETVIVKTS